MGKRRETGGTYKRGTIWWIWYVVAGERIYESAKTADKRVAASLLAQRRREIRDGTWTHPKVGGAAREAERLRARLEELAPQIAADEAEAMTVARYAEEWLERRRAANVANVHDETAWLRTWLLGHKTDDAGATLATRPIASVTRADIRAIVQAMQAATSEATGRAYAPRTILHVYSTIRLLFADALEDQHITATPCMLRARKGELPVKRDADPRWRAGAVYTRDEAEALISDERIPDDRRVYYALQLLGGMRASEAAARRWRDIDPDARPLAHLLVHSQIAKKGGAEKETKTGDVKEVPIHPTLAAVLAEWRLRGFPLRFGHAPQPDDFIIPSRRGPRIPRGGKSLPRMKQDLERLGLRSTGRARHAMRATYLTLLEIDGANMSIAARATHRTPVAPSNAVGGYLRAGWTALCAEIAKLKIELRRGVVVPMRRASGDRKSVV